MDKHYGFIYLTIDLKNGKGYIGQHKIKDQETLDPEYIGSGRIIGDIKKKYGLKRFNRQILCYCENQEELDKMEIYYINYFNAVKSENFYNIADGGNAGNKLAGKTIEEMKEYKKNMSIVQRKRYKNKEARKKQSKAQKKRYEDEKEREKTSLANKKRFQDPKEREKSSQPGEKNGMYGKGYKITGCRNGMYGKGYKMKGELNHRAKSVYCKELNILFPCIKIAEKYCINVLNSKIGIISLVCNGKRNFTGKLTDGTKLTWNWLEDVDEETLKNATYIDDEKYNELLSQNVNDCK